MSLVSQHHASHVAQACSNLKFQRLSSPVPAAVADPNASLSSVATMEVPITWTFGKESIFVMLVVPGLARSILFENNHLAATDLRVPQIEGNFGHPSSNCTTECRSDNCLLAFPNLNHRAVQSVASDVPP